MLFYKCLSKEHFTDLIIKFSQEVFHLLTKSSLLRPVQFQQDRPKFVKGCIESPQEVFACDPMKFFRYLNKKINKILSIFITIMSGFLCKGNSWVTCSESSPC